MNIKKQTLKKNRNAGGISEPKASWHPNERKQSWGMSLKIINSAFPFWKLDKGHKIIYWAFSSCSLISNTANIQRMRTSRLKVHAHWAWTILCLLCVWSLGGNLIWRQAKEWLHALFITKKMKQYSILLLSDKNRIWLIFVWKCP